MKRGKMETGCWSGPSSLSLLDPDEARYAELRRQMLQGPRDSGVNARKASGARTAGPSHREDVREPSERLAREGVGESEGRSPSDEVGCGGAQPAEFGVLLDCR